MGAAVSLEELDHLAEVTETLRNKYIRKPDSTLSAPDIKQEFERELELTRESILQLRGKPREKQQIPYL